MVDNGSSGGARPLLPGESHDEFFELCALATTELLSVEERHRLDEHLRVCPSCREMLAQYQALVDAGVPSSVAGLGENSASTSPRDASLDAAEAALFARLNGENPLPSAQARDPDEAQSLAASVAGVTSSWPGAGSRADDRLWHGLWWQFAAGIVLTIALGFSVYRSGIQKGVEMAAVGAKTTSPVAPTASPVDRKKTGTSPGGEGNSTPSGQEDATRIAALRVQLAGRVDEIAHLRQEKTALEHDLEASQTRQDQLAQAETDTTHQLAASQSGLEAAEQRLESMAARNSQSTVEVAALEHQVADLNDVLESRDQEIGRQQGLLDHDQDIRELIGSRNLYIAEVYDVDKSGNTRRPFGRVFYTKGRSLVFYAYDLDQQADPGNSGTFQAWGRRGPDQDRAVNLGVLYVDNAQKKRWVLRADSPKTLADIDAVFVTAEPAGGSSHPSGKPLLFAYLRVEPNHP
jgi:hypothetical protein